MASKKTSSNKYPCMVLCNGTSKRFGGNKMLAPLGGKPLVLHTIDRLQGQVAKLAVNGSPKVYTSLSMHPVLPDMSFEGCGPLVGIYTALKWARNLGSSNVLTVSGDTPFIPRDWVEKLDTMPSNIITLSQVEDNQHLVCGLWPTKIRSDLQAFLCKGDSYRVQDFLRVMDVQFAIFPKEGDINPFFNVNTQEDMRIAAKILATCNGHVPCRT